MKMTKNLLSISALGASLMLSGIAHASTIDLIGLSENFYQGSFAPTYQYAQSIVADDVIWADLRFGINNQNGGGTFDLIISEARVAGLEGSGFAPDVTNILSQQTLTHSGAGLQFFDIMLGLSVNIGTTYFFVLESAVGTLTPSSVRATEFAGTDKYAPGEFIYGNSSGGVNNSTDWVSRFSVGQDLAFRATFNDVSAVPIPAALPLFGTGIAFLGFMGWRRKRNAA